MSVLLWVTFVTYYYGVLLWLALLWGTTVSGTFMGALLCLALFWGMLSLLQGHYCDCHYYGGTTLIVTIIGALL